MSRSKMQFDFELSYLEQLVRARDAVHEAYEASETEHYTDRCAEAYDAMTSAVDHAADAIAPSSLADVSQFLVAFADPETPWGFTDSAGSVLTNGHVCLITPTALATPQREDGPNVARAQSDRIERDNASGRSVVLSVATLEREARALLGPDDRDVQDDDPDVSTHQVQIGEAFFSSRYLRHWIVTTARATGDESIKLLLRGEREAMRIEGTGWKAFLMPMLRAPSLELRTVAAESMTPADFGSVSP